MDLIKLSMAAAFISERTHLTWREVQFGIENELLDPRAAIDLVVDELAAQESPSSTLLELATCGMDEPVQGLVKQLANAELEPLADEIRDKWLFLVLSWIYLHKDSYRDPLRVVEEVYADFGYPERIAGFIRYMPTEEPDLGSREQNERRLYEKWRRYLDQASTAYLPKHAVGSV